MLVLSNIPSVQLILSFLPMIGSLKSLDISNFPDVAVT